MMRQWADEAVTIWREATYYYELGRYGKAKARFLQALANQPADGMTMYFIASCAFHLEETEEAEKYVRKSMQHVSNSELTHALLGAICMEQHAYEEAEENLLAVLSMNPHNAGIMAQYAYLMLKTGYEEKARKLLEEALRLEPGDETVLHYLYFFQRAYDEQTGQTMSDYMQIAGRDVDKLMKLGLSALDREAYHEARECFAQAFLLDPTNGQLLQVLEEVDMLLHPVYWPNRLLLKTGGSAIWRISLLMCLLVLIELGYDAAAVVVGIVCILFFVYTWFSPYLYTWSCKMGRRG